MSRTEHYDLAVIGSGQGGGPLAGAFARAGKRVALIERDHVGGTCVNEGCTPTKTMIASARVAHVARRGDPYGVRTRDVEIDLPRVVARKREIVSSFRSGSENALARAGVELIRGDARFTGARTIHTAAEDTDRDITADIVVIDTGLRPAVPSIDGLDRTPYLTSTSIMELDVVPDHLIVIGGGYVGLEFGQMFRRFGSAVTIIQRDAQLLPHEDSDVADEIRAILSSEGIEILVGAEPSRIETLGRGVKIEYRPSDAPDGTPLSSVTGSHLLVASGRTPNTHELNLAAAGVDVDQRGFIRVNDRLETTAPGVFAIGDVNGGPAFTHVSYDDFRILRTNLLGPGGGSTSGRVLPYTVFIDPQLGRVGMTEREARAAGKAIKVAKLPMTSVARALEVGETRGFMKALVDAGSGRILGAAVLGIEGGEIAGLLQIAMMGDLHYSALRDAMFSHPTLAESLNNLFSAMDRSD
jgi:pyruvate/2-oxoglutarate dehydrogenase complex dihydrolipoamide dehydrogenase (E3) component